MKLIDADSVLATLAIFHRHDHDNDIKRALQYRTAARQNSASVREMREGYSEWHVEYLFLSR